MLPKNSKYERPSKEKESKLFSVLLAFTMLLLSGAALGISYFSLQDEIPALYNSVRSRGWSKTEGKIVKTDVSTKSVRTGSPRNPRSATVYVPNVYYSFHVGSADYTGSRVNFAAEEKYFSSFEESRQYLDSVYRADQNVEVFYNPDDPQESALSREYVYQTDNYQAGCCCGSFGILFSILFWFSIKDLIGIFRNKNDDR